MNTGAPQPPLGATPDPSAPTTTAQIDDMTTEEVQSFLDQAATARAALAQCEGARDMSIEHCTHWRERAESAEAVIKQITEGHPNAALVCELRTRAITAEAKLAQCEEKLEAITAAIGLAEDQLRHEQQESRKAAMMLDIAPVPTNGPEGAGKRQNLSMSQRIEILTAAHAKALEDLQAHKDALAHARAAAAEWAMACAKALEDSRRIDWLEAQGQSRPGAYLATYLQDDQSLFQVFSSDRLDPFDIAKVLGEQKGTIRAAIDDAIAASTPATTGKGGAK